MPLPASWADHLFAKLSVRWGAAFLRQWPDTDPALVKADWAEVLDGTSAEALSYALRFLPAAPCNAMQFRDLCRRAPVASGPALEAPGGRADPERLKAILDAVRDALASDDGLAPAEKCARNILRIVARRNGAVSMAQREQLLAMAHLLTPQTREAAGRVVPGLGEAARARTVSEGAA